MENLFNILEMAKVLLGANLSEEHHEEAEVAQAHNDMGKFSPRENRPITGERDIIRVEEATADFAHGDGERVYVYCRTEIYRAADWEPEVSGVLDVQSDPVAQGGVATGTPWAPAAAEPEGVAPQAPVGWKALLHQVKRRPPAAGIFARGADETAAVWWKVTEDDILWKETQGLCPFPSGEAFRYGHIIVGAGRCEGFSKEESEREYFIGIPGRFFRREQPIWGNDSKTPFSLWQPMNGAEKLFDRIEAADTETLEIAFGYWIGRVDVGTGQVMEV